MTSMIYSSTPNGRHLRMRIKTVLYHINVECVESLLDKSRVLSWSDYGTVYTRLDKNSFFLHTSNCKSVSSPYSYRARTLVEQARRIK